MKYITVDEVKKMTDTEGLILQGCGGDANDWVKGINELLTDEGILLDGDTFKDVSVFEHNGLMNMLFGMEDVKLDTGKLAMWRLATHENFGGTWLSDYLPNKLGINIDETIISVTEEEALPIAAFSEQPSPYCAGFYTEDQGEDGNSNAGAHFPLRVYIENIHDERIGGFTIPLPTTAEALRPFLDGAEITGRWDIKVCEVESDIMYLSDALNEHIEKAGSHDMLDELNYLAVRLGELGETGHDIFSAVIDAGNRCGNMAEIINLTFTENLNCFDVFPCFGEEQYGEFWVDVIGKDKHAEAFNRLNESDDPDNRALAEYIEELEAHIDHAAFGRTIAKEENGVFTKNGYLIGCGGLQEFYKSPLDIPAEYRLFTNPDEIDRPSGKLQNADITETLVKLHAVCGGQMHSAAGNIKTLISEQSTDYLLSVSRSGISFSSAQDAYKRGGSVFNMFSMEGILAEQNPDIRIFAVRVTDCGEIGGRGITGDFIELNGNALRSNITRHAVIPDRMDTVHADGTSESYDLLSWADLSKEERESLKKCEAHYPESGIRFACTRFGLLTDATERECINVGTDEFISDIAAVYMSAAENPQPDMLRVTNEAAKQILARGDADVYKLTPAGAEKLTPVEAARSVCFVNHREFAIKRGDATGLDKWARSTVGNILRQSEREEHMKPKSKGEEL